MDNRFFEGMAPGVDHLATKTGCEDSSTVGEGQRSQNRMQRLLRAVGQRLRPGLPSQSTASGEPGPSDNTTQQGTGHEWWRYYTPFGPAGMYGPGTRWGGSIW